MQYAFRQTALTPQKMTRLVSTESSVLHQLMQLLNCTHTQYPEILYIHINRKLTHIMALATTLKRNI